MTAPLPASVLFWVSLAVLLYVYLGYPVLVRLLGRLRPLGTNPDPAWRPFVTACIPVVDARDSVQRKLQSVLALDWPKDRLEVIVYCDGSRDGSEEEVRLAAAADPRVRLIVGARRMGKPTALNAMVSEARGEVLLMTDIRQPLHPAALREMTSLLADPRVGCVTGNLVLKGRTGAGAYWDYEKLIRDAEARFRGLVVVTGAIYVVRRSDVSPIPEDTILDDMWIPMRLRLCGRLILYAPSAVAWDQAAEDRREFGRKTRTLAGSFQLFWRMPRMLVPFANPSWFEVFSHKLMRLLCPYFILMLAGSAAWAAAAASTRAGHVFFLVVCGFYAAFFIAALAGRRAGRAGAVARTFVVMNAAAVVGFWRWMTGRQAVTW
jgi:poly-beta-1,6-N-acetyl-D-glucosamine synthase